MADGPHPWLVFGIMKDGVVNNGFETGQQICISLIMPKKTNIGNY